MTRMLVIVALLAGCAGTQDTPVVMPDPPAATMLDTIATVRQNVELAGRLVALVCEAEGQGSEVCGSLETSWRVVTSALGEADRVIESFAQNGVGFTSVMTAVDALFDALTKMDDTVAQARGSITDAALSTHQRASLYCPGFGGMVVEPSDQARQHPTTATPDSKQVPAPKAP